MMEEKSPVPEPATVNYKGQDYEMTPMNREMEAVLEDWVIKQAISWGESPVDYLKGSEKFLKVLMSVRGQQEMAYLMLGANNPEMTRELASEIWLAEIDQLAEKGKELGLESESKE